MHRLVFLLFFLAEPVAAEVTREQCIHLIQGATEAAHQTMASATTRAMLVSLSDQEADALLEAANAAQAAINDYLAAVNDFCEAKFSS